MIALALALALAARSPAPDHGGFAVYEFGVGRDSCASWQTSATTSRDGENYIFGAWTGLNMANPHTHMVGRSTDGSGVIAEVKLYCEQHPSLSLAGAVAAVYQVMGASGR